MLGFGCLGYKGYVSSLLLNFSIAVILAFVIYVIYKVHANGVDNGKESDPETTKEHMRVLFDKFDKDAGGIDPAEVKCIMLQIDPEVEDAAVDKLFAIADTDGSGVIDFDEFLAAVTHEDKENFSLDELVKSKEKFDLKSEALDQIFLLVFVMYPGLTNKVFQGFMCRDIGNNISVLDADYQLQCFTIAWNITASVCNALILLWPIGIPTLLFFKMYKARELIKKGDEDTLKTWDFALGDYDADHWYWECVELGRKMIMTGVVDLLGRGTIIQVFLATVISFFFFAASLA
jgi:hypothetical protein